MTLRLSDSMERIPAIRRGCLEMKFNRSRFSLSGLSPCILGLGLLVVELLTCTWAGQTPFLPAFGTPLI